MLTYSVSNSQGVDHTRSFSLNETATEVTTEVLPFRGILYNTEKVRGEDVLSPPYDVISPELKDRLYGKSPYNIVRIDFGKDSPGDGDSENRYTRARRHLEEWLSEGILKETEKPAFYLYEARYAVRGEERVMRGVFGRVRITELCKGVFPHEATHSKPKADRLTLMHHCNANTSPIFSIYNSPARGYLDIFERTLSTSPYISAHDLTGALHSMWIIDDPADVEAIEEELRGKRIYIADGHHRYETALAYLDEMRGRNPSHSGSEPYNFVMMYLVNIADGGLEILPTHRLVTTLEPRSRDFSGRGLLAPLERFFDITTVGAGVDIVSEIAGLDHGIGVALRGRDERFVLRLREADLSDVPEPLRDLDVTLLHELIFKKLYNVEGISYEMDPGACLDKVREGSCQAAFFLNPTRVEDVERVAGACLRMPPKSTYFFPKILTGFVINRLQ